MADNEEHEGASPKELLIEACRRNNTALLEDTLQGLADAEITRLLNETTTVMGNHLYHEAALQGHYEIIDLLLDQPDFECDPTNLLEGDTPLHSAVRWTNAQPAAAAGRPLIEMMLEAGSSPRVRNRAGLTPLQLVDPANGPLRDLMRRHEYATANAGDFVNAPAAASVPVRDSTAAAAPQQQPGHQPDADLADFSGSDDEERAEWEKSRRNKAP